MIGEKYQFGNQAEELPMERSEDFQDRNLVAEKIIISRAAATERLGSANIHLTAENLYGSLYEPDKASDLADQNPEYPDRMDVLSAHLHSKPESIPSKEEFIAVVKHALTREVDFKECFSEVAKEQFYNAMAKSEMTVLWTEGDDTGVPERGFPGSHEQIIKVANVGFFNKMRREIAKNRGGVASCEVLSVVATEKKMRFIPKIVEKFERRGVERVVIVEDRLKNLIEAENIIQKLSKMETFPVLIKKGFLKENQGEKFAGTTHALHNLDGIQGLMLLLDAEGVFADNKKIGAIFDMDGVLSDDSVRKKLQADAVIDALKKKGWV